MVPVTAAGRGLTIVLIVTGVGSFLRVMASSAELFLKRRDNRARHPGDINRVYLQLIHHWLSYTEHLQQDYPYLYSLAVRTNPFKRDASATVS